MSKSYDRNIERLKANISSVTAKQRDINTRTAQISISKLEVKVTFGIWVFFIKNHMYLIFFLKDSIFRSGILARYIQNHDLRLQKLFYSSHAGYQRRLGY